MWPDAVAWHFLFSQKQNGRINTGLCLQSRRTNVRLKYSAWPPAASPADSGTTFVLDDSWCLVLQCRWTDVKHIRAFFCCSFAPRSRRDIKHAANYLRFLWIGFHSLSQVSCSGQDPLVVAVCGTSETVKRDPGSAAGECLSRLIRDLNTADCNAPGTSAHRCFNFCHNSRGVHFWTAISWRPLIAITTVIPGEFKHVHCLTGGSLHGLFVI